METAASQFEIKQLNESGQIAGLLAGFNNVDRQGDVISSQAFSRTLAERGERPLPMLLHHDQQRPVGAWLKFRETPEGLYAEGELTLGTRDADEAHALAKAGALTGLSIGYVAKSARTDARSGERALLDLDLVEGSLVTVPSNPKSHVSSVKSITCAKDIADLLKGSGVSGRQAKAAAGAAWQQLSTKDSEAHLDPEVEALLRNTTARIRAIGVRK